MPTRRGRRPLSRTLLLAGSALCVSSVSFADSVQVTRAGCAYGVHVVARDARFSDVLASLAKALDFEVSFEAANNPLISLDVVAQPSELLARMSPDANISATQASDPRCPNQKRILKVWVLSASTEGPSPPAVSAALTLSETPEQKKLAQEGIDLYMRAHGVDPDAKKALSSAH